MKIVEYQQKKGVYRDMTEEEEEELRRLAAETLPAMPTQLDRIEAQVLWTALMTDTFLEG